MTTIEITDSIPADKLMLDGIDVSREPKFSVGEIAKVFFGRSSHWIRWNERRGKILLDGEAVGADRSESGARRYDLADIEKMAHALAQTGAIDGEQLRNALHIVQIQARIYKYLGPDVDGL